MHVVRRAFYCLEIISHSRRAESENWSTHTTLSCSSTTFAFSHLEQKDSAKFLSPSAAADAEEISISGELFSSLHSGRFVSQLSQLSPS